MQGACPRIRRGRLLILGQAPGVKLISKDLLARSDKVLRRGATGAIEAEIRTGIHEIHQR
jgi:hypothetical protein